MRGMNGVNAGQVYPGDGYDLEDEDYEACSGQGKDSDELFPFFACRGSCQRHPLCCQQGWNWKKKVINRKQKSSTGHHSCCQFKKEVVRK